MEVAIVICAVVDVLILISILGLMIVKGSVSDEAAKYMAAAMGFCMIVFPLSAGLENYIENSPQVVDISGVSITYKDVSVKIIGGNNTITCDNCKIIDAGIGNTVIYKNTRD